ncbi:Putative ankyrin repeat protein MM_0045 [Geodia barretti]|uniref:Ankyrin repeat protein MM_0045 n=1 Tax=Geodia barretti TaxID=519541 RepID=A0AA35WTN1_GEOBA|nr:Putative ankyrin repeat protein MM_0045 [Geodia barretti]
MASSSNPSTLQVCDAIRKLSLEETRDLAFQMGVPVKDIDNITERYSGEMQKVHLVQTWMDMVPDASWAKLVAGVRKINKNSLATEIESQFIPRGPVLSSDSSSVLSTSCLPLSAEPSTSVSVAPLTPLTPLPPPPPVLPPPYDTDHIFQQRVAETEGSIEHLQEEFSDLKSDARESLSERESQDPKFVRKFRDHLLDLPVTKKQVHVRFFSRNEDDILKAETIQKLFLILGRYCNYTNYEIIFHVVKRFCHTLRGRMTNYRDSLVAFEKSTTVDVYLCAISARPSGKVSEGFIRMTMKISKSPSECSLYEIRELKESIEENASLESYGMYIDNPDEGSVLVVLHVHKEVCRMVVMVLTPDFRNKHLLTEVTVDGKRLTTLDDKLRSASGRGDIEAVTSLIVAGADVNYIWDRRSALMMAAEEVWTEVVSLLLAAGAKIDLQNWHGYTSLMLAAENGETEVVSLLLEAGANIDLQNESGHSVLMLAIIKGMTKVVSQLLEGGANTDLQNMLGEPTLVLAIRKGLTDIVSLLMKAGANIDIQDKRGDSPLMVAVWQGRTEVVSLLLEAGANTDLQNERGDSAVILATVKFHLSVLKELVRAGADLNLQNQEMLTALMISSRSVD